MASLKPLYETSALDSPEHFRAALCSWFDRNGKDYPWRRTKDPYAVLVSEVMLQQTRIATVLGKNYYTRFLEKFPDLEALSKADDTSLLKAWEGLGYYRRARMLRATATAVLKTHNGKFPKKESDLLALPGIGHYTASALGSFAFNRESSLVDGNVSRVLSRIMNDAEPIDASTAIRKHRVWAGFLCDPDQPAKYQHAIMELGQTICTPQNPKCMDCPIARFCKCPEPNSLPKRKPRPVITHIHEHAIWARDHEGRLLLHHENGARRTGLWKLPIRDPESLVGLKKIYQSSYSITRYKVALQIHQVTQPTTEIPNGGDVWVDSVSLTSLPLAAPYAKAITLLASDY